MNQLQSILFAGALYTTPVQPIAPQTYYVANLSSTDGANAGDYYSVTPMPIVQPVIEPIEPVGIVHLYPVEGENEGE